MFDETGHFALVLALALESLVTVNAVNAVGGACVLPLERKSVSALALAFERTFVMSVSESRSGRSISPATEGGTRLPPSSALAPTGPSSERPSTSSVGTTGHDISQASQNRARAQRNERGK